MLSKQALTFLSQNLIQTLLHKCSDSILNIPFHPACFLPEPGVCDLTGATSAQYSPSQQLSPLTSSRTPTNYKKPSHPPPCRSALCKLKLPDSTTSFSTRSKPVQLFEELSSHSSNFYHELQQHLKSAKTQRDQLLLPCDRQQTGGGRMSCKHKALHYAQTQFWC